MVAGFSGVILIAKYQDKLKSVKMHTKGNSIMKVVNILNFIRQCEPRELEIDQITKFAVTKGYITEEERLANINNAQWRFDKTAYVLFRTAKSQFDMALELDLPNTFLLQYDALCDERYVKLMNGRNEKTEVGLWLEIVKPLTEACGIEYKSKFGWAWDWHVSPGFLMGYLPREREQIIDEAMRKFKECFGEYPKSVGSWLLDAHSVAYMSDKYGVHAFCICRDQVSTDAYTLIGGYFNQGYFPSRKNPFTPAKTAENRIPSPIFRMLGPDPIHNYDMEKYSSPDASMHVYTMEACGPTGKHTEVTDWYYRTYFANEDMGFSYTQIGQENSFCMCDIVTPTVMMTERAKLFSDVEFMTLSQTGDAFVEKYGDKTPATAVCALDNWDSEDCQSVYYDCENYTANIFRHNEKVFIRSLYLFDENAEDYYLESTCETFEGIYENQPVVDTIYKLGEDTADRDWFLDSCGAPLSVHRLSDSELEVYWGDKSVVFSESGIKLKNVEISFVIGETKAEVNVIAEKGRIEYRFRNRGYAVNVSEGKISESNGSYTVSSDSGKILLGFEVEV